MEAGRNDPCPCGSGKKYKKCCMKKESVIQLQEVKEERFFQQKHLLVNQIEDFITEKIPLQSFLRLQAQFRERTGGAAGEMTESFFLFWLHFFHRYENGLRGIEWFLREKAHQLPIPEKTMAERWSSLRPQLVQAIDETPSKMIFKDYVTGQIYPVHKSEQNRAGSFPWSGTFALLEPMEDIYYPNGVWVFAGPQKFNRAAVHARQLIEQSDTDDHQVLMDYYPEILSTLLSAVKTEEYEEKEITAYTYIFSLTNVPRAENFLYNDEDFEIEYWEKQEKRLIWPGNWQVYTDNQLDGEIRLADLNASMEVKERTLTFTSYDVEIVHQFLKKLRRAEGAIIPIDDRKEVVAVPSQIDITQKIIFADKEVPAHFLLYAQQAVANDLDHPIPDHAHFSLRELVENGQKELAEEWLKQSEYNISRLVQEKHGAVDVTADFNTPRRELGLPLSPFVSGGSDRRSQIKPFEGEKRETIVLEEDIPVYEAIGFTPETVNNFYTKDLVSFYKEKAKGKSEATERKYRNGLFVIREVLEEKQLQRWTDADSDFWESLLAREFFERNPAVSKAMVKDFLTAVKGLAKWLAREGKLKLEKEITALAKSYEPRMLAAVELLNVFNPYTARAYHPEMHEIASALQQIGKNIEQSEAGEFKIESVRSKSTRTRNLQTGEELTLAFDRDILQFVEEGMVLSGKVGKSKSAKLWTVIQLDFVTLD